MTGYTPDIVAGMIRKAFFEGAGFKDEGEVADDLWNNSNAKSDAAKMIQVASDPSVADHVLSLYRLWANRAPAGSTPEEAFKHASGLMKQMHELLGDPPLDTNPYEGRKPDGERA